MSDVHEVPDGGFVWIKVDEVALHISRGVWDHSARVVAYRGDGDLAREHLGAVEFIVGQPPVLTKPHPEMKEGERFKDEFHAASARARATDAALLDMMIAALEAGDVAAALDHLCRWRETTREIDRAAP